MARKEKNDYFQMILSQMQHTHDAAVLLEGILTDYHAELLPSNRRRMHEIEHRADLLKHDMMENLIREFLPPIEREDLRALSEQIDTATDLIEDVVNKVYIYNVQRVRPEALEFTSLIRCAAENLVRVAENLGEFRKNGAAIERCIVDVNRLEEDGDRLYIECMARLFREEGDMLGMIAWRDLFNSLEQCMDACEHVADVVESVILKNS